MDTLITSLQQCSAHLPESFRSEHAALFVDEHLRTLADRLIALQENGVPDSYPPPYLEAECSPPLADVWTEFQPSIDLWQNATNRTSPEVLQSLADVLPAAGTQNLLILLGQRLTPASITDARAIPPICDQLLSAANQLHKPPEKLTVAARALSKHVHRCPDQFWGEVRGSSEYCNDLANRAITTILEQKTWWNVFGHYQHKLVYEARVPTGHGARWILGGEFVGFLEPFESYGDTHP